AIVGGGTAGLAIAYRLQRAGRKAVLYEASNRFGGRMFTRRNFTEEGLFCELGGELVDTGHDELKSLCRELGVGIQRLTAEGETDEDIWDIGGALRRSRDFLDPKTGEGAFAPLAAKIAADQAALLDADENWTARARALDSLSLGAYLDMLRPLTKPWAIDALKFAYHAEFGISVERQSALNLVDFIGVETDEDFALFGESDELFRIEGGSSSLPDALLKAIENKVELKKGRTLKRIATEGEDILLGFDEGETVRAGVVALALPFTRLREVEGLDALGVSAEKLRCVRELGYGDNAKIMTATTGRPWKTPTRRGFSFTGALYSDRGFGIVWDASRGQVGEAAC
ncbi:MAG: FAD-dependent oxidoreductase, partial [Parvularculaceae bacterium]|nr:FAD-dependent oxidoreductase [Parvularculaceae bacterium]